MELYGTRHLVDIETRQHAESVVERVFLSVKHLCTGRGDVRERLISAVEDLIFLQEYQFPEKLRNDFLWVIAQSTKYDSQFPQYRGNIEETMKRIRRSTGEKIAGKIFYIYSEIQNIRGFPLLDYRDPKE